MCTRIKVKSSTQPEQQYAFSFSFTYSTRLIAKKKKKKWLNSTYHIDVSELRCFEVKNRKIDLTVWFHEVPSTYDVSKAGDEECQTARRDTNLYRLTAL